MPFVDEIFRLLGPRLHVRPPLGSYTYVHMHVATLRGKAHYLLLGERITLNLLARCSGIATASKRTKDLAESYGFRGVIASTRKTIPGISGIYTAPWARTSFHNADLSLSLASDLSRSTIIISGSVTATITRAREVGGFSLLLDVEANEAITVGADVIMLDNIEGGELVSVARRLRDRWAGEGKKFLLETSGGITESNLREHAISGRWIPALLQAFIVITSRNRYSEHELCTPIGAALRLQPEDPGAPPAEC
ncbi:Quinolinate phosphoribosyl transferase [Lactarius hatsudake]|nr:Quinolinate phosphoribosyl transferase [Lactarius hatsudake]